MENRKFFFIDFARESGFDPLVARNWYNVPLSVVSKFKVDAGREGSERG